VEYVSKLLIEKERAIYWVCALLERDGVDTRAGARRALADLGYDRRRIEAMLLLGEPHRASEETLILRPWTRTPRATTREVSMRS
jgi:hypothetical protein